LNIAQIKKLSPDLIIANKEENVKEQIEALQQFTEVLVTDIKTPEDNLDLISHIGELTNKRLTALSVTSTLSISAAYLIWKEPYMTVGSDTYIHALMKKCGLQNIYGHKTRYPETTFIELKKLQPKLILLSSEPYPFKEKHIKAIETAIPEAKVILVDGEAFSWYGTRLIKTVPYLTELISSIIEA